MIVRYDARGNVYAVATPAQARGHGVPIPFDPAEAALSRLSWAKPAVDALCGRAWGGDGPGAKPHGTDGLLVGPFQDRPPFDVLIVNTDGTLAERSGNGLTIFSKMLADLGLLGAEASVLLRVHHDQPGLASPAVTGVRAAMDLGGQPAFWLDMGTPLFGPEAVGATRRGIRPAEDGAYQVARLAGLDPSWCGSVFVRIGNPHCVTVLPDTAALPGMEALRASVLHARLASIAYAAPAQGNVGARGTGDPCPSGVNLQWAAPASRARIMARVFERGEGPTASSGTSATAVACAFWRLGLVGATGRCGDAWRHRTIGTGGGRRAAQPGAAPGRGHPVPASGLIAASAGAPLGQPALRT